MNRGKFRKYAFPFSVGKYIGGGMRVKTLNQMEGFTDHPERTFFDDCMAGKDLPIMCDSCDNSDYENSKCKLHKIDKIKFYELQEKDYCKDYREIV